METVVNLELYLLPFSASFLVLLFFFFPDVEGVMKVGTKELKPRKKMEIWMLHQFIQCYSDVFSFILCSSPNSH